MDKKDVKPFVELWKQVSVLYGREINEQAYGLVFNALKEFDFEDVRNAVSLHLQKSKFMPTVADIYEQVKCLKGIDTEALKAKANNFYNQINDHLDTGCDYICDDPRAVFAFRSAFGSLAEFGMHSTAQDPFDRKAFVDAYVNARGEFARGMTCPNLIQGRNHFSPIVRVRFIGKADKCRKALTDIYSFSKQKAKVVTFEQNKSVIPELKNPVHQETEFNVEINGQRFKNGLDALNAVLSSFSITPINTKA